MINSTAFDYVNVLTKAADASYQREAILANNISNVDTPGYKRKLYKSGKSNVEIAKLLSLGTGEVKLIIDLYKEGK